ncbi:MAG: heme-copper oxidase subunit III [Betaproteobacteria bacterium]|nr:heme-copper oxidase subunit III [Betaproteobacteria bacterium]
MPRNTVESSLAPEVEHFALHWETSVWPLVLGVGVLLVLPLPFSFHFVYQQSFLAVLCLGVGVPLTVVAIAGWVNEGLAGHGEGLSTPAMGWFILAEALLFLGFFAAYWVIRLSAPAWPPAGSVPMPTVIPAVMTVLLVSSSFTYYAAEAAHEKGRDDGFRAWLGVSIALGAAFVGLSAYEWSDLMGQGFSIGTNAFGTSFYSITGFHASHVVVGLGVFLAILLPALGGRTSAGLIKAGGIYWHFVDIVWLFVVSQVYFL